MVEVTRSPHRRPSHVGASAKLASIYDEMRSRQLKAIQKAGVLRSDPFFVPDGKLGEDSVPADAIHGEEVVDDRRCLAISSVINDSVDCRWTSSFRELTRRLHDEFDEYGLTFSQHPGPVGGGQLHWTLMQLVGFPDYEEQVGSSGTDASSPFLSAEYLDCVQDSLTVCGLDTAIQITYIGVVVVATGVLMVGIPSLDINEARDAVRSRLADRGLPLKEPFVNDIVHSTLFRVAGDAASMPEGLHLKLIELAKDFESVNLGTVMLDRFQIGPASWRVLPSEMEATPPLRSWTLQHKTPREKFEENVITEDEGDGRGCFTVSGALGAKLAKEVRLVLSKKSSTNGDPARPATPPESVTPPKMDDSSEEPENRVPSPPTTVLYEMENAPSVVREHVQSANLSETVPQASLYVAEDEQVAYDHAATISGAGGLALAQELQKKLEEEKRALNRMYYTDFY